MIEKDRQTDTQCERDGLLEGERGRLRKEAKRTSIANR